MYEDMKDSKQLSCAVTEDLFKCYLHKQNMGLSDCFCNIVPISQMDRQSLCRFKVIPSWTSWQASTL